MRKRFARAYDWLDDAAARIYVGIGFAVALAVISFGIWVAQGPILHNKVTALHKQYRDRSAVVIAESNILAGSTYGLEDHRAVTVRYTNFRGGTSTWQFLANWKTQIGQREHIVIDRHGARWAERNLEDEGKDNPLKPDQGWTVFFGVIISLILGVAVGIAVGFVAAFVLNILLVALARAAPAPDGV